MRIGIDIGGTHTDGVLVDGERLLAAAKTPTHHSNLLESINQILLAVLEGQDPAAVRVLNLGTTLSTNAIATGNVDPVGMLISGGPGIDPQHYRIGEHFHAIPGSMDHLGNETKRLDASALQGAIEQCQQAGIRHYAVAAKFSVRNPVHENQMWQALADHADCVACGHRLSGHLNFGRRVYTAYYNAAVWSIFYRFATALHASLKGFQLQAEVNILKADGGTIPLRRALDMPVQSIFSGPAASVMGILATTKTDTDMLMVDIGGTTSDVALFAAGHPLLEREGIAIADHPTLVRAIQVESIAIGGDSCITVADNGTVQTGPQRLGPSMAVNGPAPTFMDACNVLGRAAFGDKEKSRQGMEALASAHGLAVEQLARAAVDAALDHLCAGIAHMIDRINAKPVYTIHEILENRTIIPEKIVVIGGPAEVFQQLLSTRMHIPVEVGPLASVSNALGAALTRNTSHLSLTADTSRGKMAVPDLDVFHSINRTFSLDDAIKEAKKLLVEDQAASGVKVEESDIQITQADAFAMVEGGYRSGQNIRVVAQVQPAVIGQVRDQSINVRVLRPV